MTWRRRWRLASWLRCERGCFCSGVGTGARGYLGGDVEPSALGRHHVVVRLPSLSWSWGSIGSPSPRASDRWLERPWADLAFALWLVALFCVGRWVFNDDDTWPNTFTHVLQAVSFAAYAAVALAWCLRQLRHQNLGPDHRD